MTTDARKARLRRLTREGKIDMLTWDWKEQVPVDEVVEAAAKGFVKMYPVDDTGGDFYALLISQVELEPDDVQLVFEYVEESWGDEAEVGPAAHRTQDYKMVTLEIEILVEQDTAIITNELARAMSKLEDLKLDITNWQFTESPVYAKVED